jgi:hypothetical protein
MPTTNDVCADESIYLRRRATLDVTHAFDASSSQEGAGGKGEGQEDAEEEEDIYLSPSPAVPRLLHLSYDVTHPADAQIVKLDELGDALSSVRCTPDALHLTFYSPDAARAFHDELAAISSASVIAPRLHEKNVVGDAVEDEQEQQQQQQQHQYRRVVVAGGPEWQCAKPPAAVPHSTSAYSSPHGIILRKSSAESLRKTLRLTRAAANAGAAAKSKYQHNDSSSSSSSISISSSLVTVSFATEEAGYHDVFQTASIRFRTSAFPDKSFRQHDHPVAAVAAVDVAPAFGGAVRADKKEEEEEDEDTEEEEEALHRRRLFGWDDLPVSGIFNKVVDLGTKGLAGITKAASTVVKAVNYAGEVRACVRACVLEAAREHYAHVYGSNECWMMRE